MAATKKERILKAHKRDCLASDAEIASRAGGASLSYVSKIRREYERKLEIAFIRQQNTTGYEKKLEKGNASSLKDKAWIDAGIEKTREQAAAYQPPNVAARYKSGELWCVVCEDCDEQMFLDKHDDGTAYAACPVGRRCGNEWSGPTRLAT